MESAAHCTLTNWPSLSLCAICSVSKCLFSNDWWNWHNVYVAWTAPIFCQHSVVWNKRITDIYHLSPFYCIKNYIYQCWSNFHDIPVSRSVYLSVSNSPYPLSTFPPIDTSPANHSADKQGQMGHVSSVAQSLYVPIMVGSMHHSMDW